MPKFLLELEEYACPVPPAALDLKPVSFPWPGFVNSGNGNTHVEGAGVRLDNASPLTSSTVTLFETPSTVIIAYYMKPGEYFDIRSNGVIFANVPEGANVSSEDQPFTTPVGNCTQLYNINFLAAAWDGQHLYMKSEQGKLQVSSVAHPPVTPGTVIKGSTLIYNIKKYQGWIGEEACNEVFKQMRSDLR